MVMSFNLPVVSSWQRNCFLGKQFKYAMLVFMFENNILQTLNQMKTVVLANFTLNSWILKMLNAYHWNNDFKTTKESIKISSKFMDIMSVLKLDSHYLKKISKTRTDLCGASKWCRSIHYSNFSHFIYH